MEWWRGLGCGDGDCVVTLSMTAGADGKGQLGLLVFVMVWMPSRRRHRTQNSSALVDVENKAMLMITDLIASPVSTSLYYM